MKTVKKLLLSVLRIFTAVFLVCACVIVLGSVLPYLSDLKHSKLSFSQDKHTTAPHKDTTPTEKSQPDKIRAEAESGDAESQFILGDRYFFGKADYPQDDKKAFEWFYKAYEHEEPANCANIALGNMYSNQALKRTVYFFWNRFRAYLF